MTFGLASLSRCGASQLLRRFPRHHHYFHSSAYKEALTIGLYRETYGQWERRVPLTPTQVQTLLSEIGSKSENDDGVKFQVQPSAQRIFPDSDYEKAGASVQEDLSNADVILGVKRPKQDTALIPDKTYMFFSHVIKGQPENMALLNETLKRKVQLIDYERITGPDKKRLVSFGKYAGLAGALDSFHAVGRRLLYKYGASTPFLSFPSNSIMHDSLEDAKAKVVQMGQRLAKEGIHMNNEPIVFAITGKGGAVHNGVMEILTLLPHEMISVKDLPKLYQEHSSEAQKKVYLCQISPEDIYQRHDAHEGDVFDKDEFYQHPSQYRCLFAKRVVPYVQAIVNATYWDARFPRLLTKRQMKRIRQDGNDRLLFVADISCDIHGSIEFLERSTVIEKPFFTYDPIEEREVINDISDSGITILGVDILPSELPRESSDHFGSAVKGVVKELANAKAKQDKSVKGIDPKLLTPGLADACITNSDGTLAEGFEYLETMMHRTIKEQKPARKTMILALQGHLFDSGLINQILDVVEHHGHGVEFQECNFPPQSGRATTKSSVVLKIDGQDEFSLHLIETKVMSLVELIEKAEAECVRLDHEENVDNQHTSRVTVQGRDREKRVLLLGAGRVSKSFVEFLGRSGGEIITVASDNEADAREVAAAAEKGQAVGMDILNDVHKLSELIEESDLVVSLLPAPMHPPVALECILHGTDLVTASYESEEMRHMNERAKAAGIKILNEVGLDPGLDHMSAMKLIHDIQERGGQVTRFSSVCGGLPAPEAANNPLKYKFSWSPRGVIRASQNSARYRHNGQIVEVPGEALLQAGEPLPEAFPELGLECLPNRNSLQYEDVYGIQGASTIFRGTLRYGGFCSLMSIFQQMGFFSEEEADVATWGDLISTLKDKRGKFETLNDFVLQCAKGDAAEAKRAMDTMNWLGMLSQGQVSNTQTVVDNFCDLLENKLSFAANELDMTVMHHSIDALFPDGTEEHHRSSLQVFGDDKHSAMSKTVGFTTAASAELILEGALNDEVGLIMPTVPKVYLPVLDSVALEGIVFDERMTAIPPSSAKSA